MQAFITSVTTVTIAEIGDKTQLLALLLACRFRHSALAIISAIFCSTLLNHLAAAWLGNWLFTHIPMHYVHYLLPLSFLVMAAWALIPDKPEQEDGHWWQYGPFIATFVLFFIAETGDKTQIATALLSAQFSSIVWVTAGTTLGIMIANTPVIIAGSLNADRIPLILLRRITAVIFLALAIISLIAFL